MNQPWTFNMDLFQSLINEIDDKLPVIQKNFDNYQNEFFTKKPPEFFCLELNGEAGELANLEKKQWKGSVINKEAFAEEAADVFIALINYSNSRNIDLADALTKKLQKIEDVRVRRKQQGLDY